MSEQGVLDLSAMGEAVQKDPETIMLIHKMKCEQSLELVGLRKFSIDQIMLGMKQALDEWKMVDLLFKDKHCAVEEMYKEGMIEKAHLKTYHKHPEWLEKDAWREHLAFSMMQSPNQNEASHSQTNVGMHAMLQQTVVLHKMVGNEIWSVDQWPWEEARVQVSVHEKQ